MGLISEEQSASLLSGGETEGQNKKSHSVMIIPPDNIAQPCLNNKNVEGVPA